MAARLPVRILARHARTQYLRRPFSSSSHNLEAHNFMMPAMSPTMTEGNIASWKVKEGDSFQTGDVLLEIETDKASMDVEAQDDGVMAKIFQGDGSKSVKVGTRIAVIADAGDDVSSIEIPEDTSQPVSSEASGGQEEQKSEPPPSKEMSQPKQSTQKSKSAPSGPGQNPKYPLYPSVQSLLQQNNIPESDVSKIPATGPNGRLLKGDVLAYVGSIPGDYSKEQSDRIVKLGHLDLSNIKVATEKTASASAGATTGPVDLASEEGAMPKITSISLPISLAEVLKVQKRIQDTLGVTMPLSTFLARAVDFANDDLPVPKGAKPSQDDLFNAVLGLDTIDSSYGGSRGTYLPQIDALPMGGVPTTSIPRAARYVPRPDIIDVLSGKVKPVRSAVGRARLAPSGPGTVPSRGLATAGGAINMFSLVVPLGEEKRARAFLERMKTILQVEPGRLVL